MIRLTQRKPPTLNNSLKNSRYNYGTLTQTSRLWLKMHTSQLLQLRNGRPQLVNSQRSYSSSIPSLIDNNNIPFSKPQSPNPGKNWFLFFSFYFLTFLEIQNSNINTPKPTTGPQQPGYGFYKPNLVPERGAAFQISYSYPTRCVFITGANQKGSKLPPGTTGGQFDWENKILMKLSILECGKLLSVLDGTESTVSLFHIFEKDGMKVCNIFFYFFLK